MIGVYITDLLVESRLGGANVAYSLQQLFKVVVALPAPLLQPLVVQHKTLDDQLAELLRRPLPELGAAMRPNPVADRDDNVEVVMVNFTLDLPCALQLNYSEFPNSWVSLKLALIVHTLNMLIDRGYNFLKQLCQSPLAQPDGLVEELDLNACLSVCRSVEQKLGAVA